jgi:hypothetical protein
LAGSSTTDKADNEQATFSGVATIRTSIAQSNSFRSANNLYQPRFYPDRMLVSRLVNDSTDMKFEPILVDSIALESYNSKNPAVTKFKKSLGLQIIIVRQSTRKFDNANSIPTLYLNADSIQA